MGSGDSGIGQLPVGDLVIDGIRDVDPYRKDPAARSVGDPPSQEPLRFLGEQEGTSARPSLRVPDVQKAPVNIDIIDSNPQPLAIRPDALVDHEAGEISERVVPTRVLEIRVHLFASQHQFVERIPVARDFHADERIALEPPMGRSESRKLPHCMNVLSDCDFEPTGRPSPSHVIQYVSLCPGPDHALAHKRLPT